MLEQNSFEVYKHYDGYICSNINGIPYVKGGFNLVNIGKLKDEYLITLEHAVLDNNIISSMQRVRISSGRAVRLTDCPIKLTLIYKVSRPDIKVPEVVTKLANGNKIEEWSCKELIPQMIVLGEPLSPLISRVLLLTLKASEININTNSINTIEVEDTLFPVLNRESATPSIYGPLV